MDTQNYLQLVEVAARKAGSLLRDAYSADAGVVSAVGKDIKTEADRAAEKVILESLRPTGLGILSEESGVVQKSGSKRQNSSVKNDLTTQRINLSSPTWIIDPLDGTFNFTRGFPACCVAIGLWAENQPVLGVIYDFVSDKMYSGIVGEGAFCNDEVMSVSTTGSYASASLATGFPSARDYSDASLADSICKVQQFKKIRMIGSAALSIAHVANGALDAYFEEDIWLWDVAAGLALVQAAGGDYSISEIKDSWQLDVFASNGLLSDLRGKKASKNKF
jgi:myo-inositol-1(or 4)-monophosphatase